MKKIKYTLACLFLLLTAVSCKKDWLDVTASNQIKAEDQFKQTSGFRDGLMGVYISLTKPELYSRDMTWNMVDLLSQQYATLTSLARYDQVQQFNYKSLEASSKVDAVWNKQYNSIANINVVLDHIDKSEGVLHPIDQAIIKGELLGLRAFLHFDLIRLFGQSNYANRPELKSKLTIPYVLSFSKESAPQLSYEATFALLEKDLTEALKLLEQDPIYTKIQRPADYYTEVNRGGFYNGREKRMNYYAVKALLARVLLWQGGAKTEGAGIAAEDVIANSPARLIATGTNVSNDRVLSSEHLFNLDVNAFANLVNEFLNAEQVTNYDALYIPNTTAQELYETNIPTVGLVDIRYNTLLSSQARGKVSVKLLQVQGNSFTNIMPLVKIPEMHYIVAESRINTNLAAAITQLNTVRRSRGIIDQIPQSADKQTVEAQLFKEYRKEFVSEGQLFFYYKRTGRQQIPGLSAATIAGDQIYMLPYPDSEVEFGNRVQ